ncbi:hypothetical protein K525DRAFT_197446 [Schizophyllum commune Loenen D]|nr:hypothetical protein K525DRAFT_197446 [Schizophyllum commune Loenen D]
MSAARRKKTHAHDDASYFAPSAASLTGPGTAGTKRAHPDDARAPANKRKKVEPPVAEKPTKDEERTCPIDFKSLPPPVIHNYLATFDLIPPIYPSPLSKEDPIPPAVLLSTGLHRQASPPPPPPPVQSGPGATPANRPRRDPMTLKERETSRRRSARLLEDEELWRARPPILNDVKELNVVLSTLAERHFMGEIPGGYNAAAAAIFGGPGGSMGLSGVREEVDILAAFMCAVEKNKSAIALNGGRCP